MQFNITIFFNVTLLFFFFISSCMANCNCSPYDTGCNNRCVIDTNHCVTSCSDDVECYERCINDKWPSAAVSAPTYNAALPTSYENTPPPSYYYSGTPVIAVTTTVTQPVFPSQSGTRSLPSASQISGGTKSSISVPFILFTLMSTVIYYYV